MATSNSTYAMLRPSLSATSALKSIVALRAAAGVLISSSDCSGMQGAMSTNFGEAQYSRPNRVIILFPSVGNKADRVESVQPRGFSSLDSDASRASSALCSLGGPLS